MYNNINWLVYLNEVGHAFVSKAKAQITNIVNFTLTSN